MSPARRGTALVAALTALVLAECARGGSEPAERERIDAEIAFRLRQVTSAIDRARIHAERSARLAEGADGAIPGSMLRELFYRSKIVTTTVRLVGLVAPPAGSNARVRFDDAGYGPANLPMRGTYKYEDFAARDLVALVERRAGDEAALQELRDALAELERASEYPFTDEARRWTAQMQDARLAVAQEKVEGFAPAAARVAAWCGTLAEIVRRIERHPLVAPAIPPPGKD